MSAAARRSLTFAFVALVAVVNVAHPFLHAFEGGGLDVILAQVDMIAAHLSQRVD